MFYAPDTKPCENIKTAVTANVWIAVPLCCTNDRELSCTVRNQVFWNGFLEQLVEPANFLVLGYDEVSTYKWTVHNGVYQYNKPNIIFGTSSLFFGLSIWIVAPITS